MRGGDRGESTEERFLRAVGGVHGWCVGDVEVEVVVRLRRL